MRMIFKSFFIAVLPVFLCVSAFAELAPDWYYEQEMTDEELYYDDSNPYMSSDYDLPEEEIVAPAPQTAQAAAMKKSVPSAASGTRTASRTVAPSTNNQNARKNAPSRAVAARTAASSRTVSSRAAVTTTRPNGFITGATTISRASVASAPVAKAAANVSTASENTATVARAGANTATTAATNRRTAPATAGGKTTAARAALVEPDTVNNPLYIGRQESSRVGIRSNINAASTRFSTTRAGGLVQTTDSTVTNEIAGQTLDESTRMADYCRAQFADCMDNYCDVLDDGQGRCICSDNIKNYVHAEEVLKETTEQLQDVALKIQYIGLNKDEILTIFSQTEAEQAMQGKTDRTALKLDLDKIKKLITDVKIPDMGDMSSAGYDLSSLLDFSFDSDGFDLGNLFGNKQTVTNIRGAELYKTAYDRCYENVLKTCEGQGVDTKLVSNYYDLEIDKQCRIYEHSLNDANTNMKRTVRNAQAVLQKARLVVAQEKNQYDLRACVTALDSCMQDEFVCGTDYDNCLDPSGKFIVSGEVVVGSLPIGGTSVAPTGLYKVWNYKDATNTPQNAWDTNGTVGDFILATSGNYTAVDNISGFLQSKIGRNEEGRNYGMCVTVLNKCQDVTYDRSTKKYKPDNDVIKSYLQRTLVQIKARQDTVIAEYSENCVINLRNCLSSNGAIIGYGIGSMGTISKAMISACNAMLETCANITGDSKASLVSGAVCYAGTNIANIEGNGPFTCAATNP